MINKPGHSDVLVLADTYVFVTACSKHLTEQIPLHTKVLWISRRQKVLLTHFTENDNNIFYYCCIHFICGRLMYNVTCLNGTQNAISSSVGYYMSSIMVTIEKDIKRTYFLWKL